MKKNLLILSVIAFVSVCAGPAYSKGSPDKIVINGNGAALEITDPETLKKLDPWSGQFISWSSRRVSAPDEKAQSYEVLFYIKWPGRHSEYDQGDLKMFYAVRYVPGRDGSPGYVYLPGNGEKYYGSNISTIWRNHDDGKWHRASAEWDAIMKRLLTPAGDRQDRPNAELWYTALLALETCALFGE